MVSITVYGLRYFITPTEAIKAYAVQTELKISNQNKSFKESVKKAAVKLCVNNKNTERNRTPPEIS